MSIRPTPRRVLSSLALSLVVLAAFAAGARNDVPKPGANASAGGPVARSLVRARPFHGDLRRLPHAVMGIGSSGQIVVFCGMSSGSTDFVLDVTGYFE